MATIANIAIALTANTTNMMKGLNKAGRRFQKFRRGIGLTFGSLGGLGVAVAGALSVRAVVDTIDNFTEMRSRVQAVVGPGEALVKTQEEIFAASQRSRASTKDFTDTFAGIAVVSKDLGFSNDEVLQMTETFFKLAKITGATSDQSGRAAFQMSQSFAGGIVRAEEFNSILDGTPAVVMAVAKQMGLSMGEIRNEVIAGNILAEDWGRALLAAGADTDVAYEDIAATIKDRMTAIGNSWTEMLGALSGTAGGKALGGLITGFLENVVIALDFVTAALKRPEEAMEDWAIAWRAFKADIQPMIDFMTMIGNNPITRLVAGRVGKFLDANVQSDRFRGPKNPVLGLEEKNSALVVQKLVDLNENLSNQRVAGSFSR